MSAGGIECAAWASPPNSWLGLPVHASSARGCIRPLSAERAASTQGNGNRDYRPSALSHYGLDPRLYFDRKIPRPLSSPVAPSLLILTCSPSPLERQQELVDSPTETVNAARHMRAR